MDYGKGKMCEVITCQYCVKEYWDYLVYVMPDGSIMCVDCVRDDVPLQSAMAVA